MIVIIVIIIIIVILIIIVVIIIIVITQRKSLNENHFSVPPSLPHLSSSFYFSRFLSLFLSMSLSLLSLLHRTILLVYYSFIRLFAWIPSLIFVIPNLSYYLDPGIWLQTIHLPTQKNLNIWSICYSVALRLCIVKSCDYSAYTYSWTNFCQNLAYLESKIPHTTT